jgi:hypothetical protein
MFEQLQDSQLTAIQGGGMVHRGGEAVGFGAASP